MSACCVLEWNAEFATVMLLFLSASAYDSVFCVQRNGCPQQHNALSLEKTVSSFHWGVVLGRGAEFRKTFVIFLYRNAACPQGKWKEMQSHSNLKRRSSVQTLHFLFKEPGTGDRRELKHGNFLWEKLKLWLSKISVRYIPYLRQIRHLQKRCTPVKRTLRFRMMHLFIWRYATSSERTLHVFKGNFAYSADTAVRSFNEHMKRKQRLQFSLVGSCFFKGRLHTLWARGG